MWKMKIENSTKMEFSIQHTSSPDIVYISAVLCKHFPLRQQYKDVAQ